MPREPDIHDWTDYEKELLLIALKQCGPDDLDALCSKFPFKSRESIITKITFYKNAASKKLTKVTHLYHSAFRDRPHKRQQLPPIDEWINFITKNHLPEERSSNYSDALQIILKHENHAQETHGIDFKTLYLVLICALRGKPPPHLNVQTFNFLRDTLKNLDLLVKATSSPEKLSMISSVRPMAFRKVELWADNADNNTIAVCELRNKTAYNPLDLPLDMLQIPTPIRNDTNIPNSVLFNPTKNTVTTES